MRRWQVQRPAGGRHLGDDVCVICWPVSLPPTAPVFDGYRPTVFSFAARYLLW